MAYEEVDVPAGSYIGWGTKPKQHVTGIVLDYDETGGTDFNDGVCPLLEVELTEKAASFNKKGQRTNIPSGEVVFLSCGQKNLKRTVKGANLKRGNSIKLILEEIVEVDKGTLKKFKLLVDRGNHLDESDDSSDDDDVPF